MNTIEYLIKQLEKLGIKKFFGLPGDYNFNILYAIENNPNTDWIGCTNELNAGYSADGYAREQGYGALVTTYGVGELSAINAIAGSFSENIPVIHIVGTPTSKTLVNKTLVHHNFQNPEPLAYANAFKNVCETTAFLNRDNAKIEIDRVLKIFVKEKRPVYIAIPMDITELEITDKEIDYSWTSNEENLNKVAKLILDKINNSKHPIILGDTLIKRFESKVSFSNFVEKSGIPTTNFLMGTNLIDSESRNNLGTYFADLKNPIVQKSLEETDCLIAVGVIYSDLNAFGFNLPYKINSKIAIYGTYTYVDGIRYNDVKMKDLLELLTENIAQKEFIIEKDSIGYLPTGNPSGKLTSKYIYPRLQEFLKENDILIAETGIIQHGVSQIKYPKNAELVTQTLWGSIGWATPATLGTCLACKNRRVILFTGEGSHQMTAIELGNMLRQNIKPIILVLNNKGYTTERLLSNNPKDSFNDIVQMNYSKFARAFEGDIWSTRVETEDDFDKALKVSQIMNKLCYIEILIDPEDIPDLSKNLVDSLKAKTKESYEKSSEKIVLDKLEKNTLKTGLMNFATKVHESLK